MAQSLLSAASDKSLSLASNGSVDGKEGMCWRPVELACLLLFALIVRLVLYNGPFGSDDATYLERAAAIANGVWESSNYNGALRYGFNLPAGLLMSVFGVGHFTANLWPLLCSLGEITVVYLLAAHIWNRKTAVFAALILSCIPLHTAVATRIHADSVVCFFIAASYGLFYASEQRKSKALYFLTGIAVGLVFWTKELGIITLIPFVVYPLLVRRMDKAWLYVVAGGLSILVLHFALMTVIAGDPLHLFKVVTSQMSRTFIGQSMGIDSPWYYFRYLFFDVRHTWLAPFFALIAAMLIMRRYWGRAADGDGSRYIVFWFVGLVAVMSFFPVSLSPLRFAMKQSNYLTIFLAPIALLAGHQAAQLSHRVGYFAVGLIMLGGFFLGAFNQADYRGFTSNSKAAVTFAAKHPHALVVGTANNSAMSASYAIVEGSAKGAAPIMSFKEMALPPNELLRFNINGKTPVYVIHDLETIDWGSGGLKLHKPLPCWRELERLTPIGFGASKPLIEGIVQVTSRIPLGLLQRLTSRLEQLVKPRPAMIYRVDSGDVWCGGKPPS